MIYDAGIKLFDTKETYMIKLREMHIGRGIKSFLYSKE